MSNSLDIYPGMQDRRRVSEPFVFDPYQPTFLDNPYPTFSRLHAQRSVFYDEDWRLTFFTRHQDIKSILMDRHRFGRDSRHPWVMIDLNRNWFPACNLRMLRCG